MSPKKRSDHVRKFVKIASGALALATIITFVVPEELGAGDGKKNETARPTMFIHVGSYVCTVPSPNLKVEDEELNAFWKLPTGTKLSPLMRAVGLCRIAVQLKNRTDTPPTLCDCVNAPWPMFAAIVAFWAIVHAAVRCLACGLKKLRNPFYSNNTQTAVKNERCCAIVWLLIWMVACFSVMFQTNGAGLIFQPYGDLYQRIYYSEPRSWLPVYVMCMVQLLLNAVHVAACDNSLRKHPKSKTASPDSPGWNDAGNPAVFINVDGAKENGGKKPDQGMDEDEWPLVKKVDQSPLSDSPSLGIQWLMMEQDDEDEVVFDKEDQKPKKKEEQLSSLTDMKKSPAV